MTTARRGRPSRLSVQPQSQNQYGFAQNPATQGYDQALSDYDFHNQFAQRMNRATDRMRGSTNSAAPTVVPSTDAMTPPHDWSGFEKSFPGGVQRNNLTINRVPAGPDVNSEAVQSTLDRVQGPNAGAVARTTGQQQQTPYGTVGASWQQTVLKNHPEIGIEGSQANKDFVSAYKSATAQQGPGMPAVDPHAIAKSVTDNITKNGIVGPPNPTPSDIANTDYINQQAAKRTADAGPFTPDSTLGRGLAAIKNAPGISDEAGNLVRRGAGAIGLNSDTASAAGNATKNAVAGVGGAISSGASTAWNAAKSGLGSARDAMANLVNPTQSTRITGDDIDTARRNQWYQRAAANGTLSSPINPPREISDIEAENESALHTDPALLGKETAPPAVPITPNANASDTATDPLLIGRLEGGGKLGVGGQNQPNYLRVPRPDFPSEFGDTSVVGSRGDPIMPDRSTLSMQGDQYANDTPHYATGHIPNYAYGDDPYSDYHDPNQGMLYKAPDVYGVDNTSVGGRQIAANLANTNRGLGDQEIPRPDDTPTYARGLMPAMRREKTAIRNGVGGARPGDQPMQVSLGGQPAVINTGERVMPTPAGPAVLNRKMLSMMPNHAAGFVPPSHKGRLHRALNVPLNKKIPPGMIQTARNSRDPHMRSMAVHAVNMQQGQNAR